MLHAAAGALPSIVEKAGGGLMRVELLCGYLSRYAPDSRL